ncbi:MAG: hypothetical protein ABI559_02395 [Chloroflexota bacterium]
MEDSAALSFVLEEALSLLDAGESPESIIERFPDVAARLLPLLSLASTLRETAEDAVEVPFEALDNIGEFLQERFDDLIDRRAD